MTLLGDPRETLQNYFFKTLTIHMDYKVPSVLLIISKYRFLRWEWECPLTCDADHGTWGATWWSPHPAPVPHVSHVTDQGIKCRGGWAVWWLRTNLISVKMFSWECCWLYLHYLTHDTCLGETGDRSPLTSLQEPDVQIQNLSSLCLDFTQTLTFTNVPRSGH